ncbi:hypothetical protein B7R22_10290 [Subtercola boreus]|uniref:Uncharacterized protein n=1 Tax=Subtercola boreus TaxID=120213 RepID=A0A3E0VYW6_9MICO|nr:hypothetical protein [Subtercola boreus]RFA14007.1 hypothetical protein B7R22_10290 [Subtercola boreus]
MIVESLDRLAAGRNASIRIPEGQRTHPRTERSFTVITWLLAVELLLGITALTIASVLTLDGQQVPWPVWFRGLVVLGITTTLFYFAWRARAGYYWAYSRLRLFSRIFPIVTLVIAAIPGLYPLWMIVEQILFSLVLFGISEYLSTDHMRQAFVKPVRSLVGEATGNTVQS